MHDPGSGCRDRPRIFVNRQRKTGDGIVFRANERLMHHRINALVASALFPISSRVNLCIYLTRFMRGTVTMLARTAAAAGSGRRER